MDIKKIQEYLAKLTSKKNTFNLIVIFLIGVLLILVADFFKGTSSITPTEAKKVGTTTESASVKQTTETDYEKEQEDKLKVMLSQIEGIGRVDVMIKFDGGEENVPAVNSNSGTSNTEETDNSGGKRHTTDTTNGKTVVMQNDGTGERPVILQTLHPKVESVIIVTDGADNSDLNFKITKAVAGYFDIPSYNVYVYPMKK